MPNLAHVAARIFDAPLLVHERKLEAILGGIGARLGVRPMAFDDGDWSTQPRKPYRVQPNGVAIVPIVGVLVNRSGQIDAQSAPLRSYSAIRSDLRMALADPTVRAVVLDIDSPGGECAGCFELAAEIRGMRGRKPIVAVADGYAYSAAYALASAADVLFVSEAGGVGSVGVVALHIDQSKRDAQQGLAYEYVFAGAKKIDGTSHAPLSDSARADLNAEVLRCYGLFTALVAKNRGVAEDDVRATQAGCFYGAGAVTARMADRVGILDDAEAEAARRADALASTTTGRGPSSRSNMSKESVMDHPDEAAPNTPAGQETEAPQAPQGQTMATPPAAPAMSPEDAAGIVELCMLAGRPQAAAGFIREGKTRGEVSEALLRGRAAAQERSQVSGSHGVPDTAGATRISNPADPHGWNASIERVCGAQGRA